MSRSLLLASLLLTAAPHAQSFDGLGLLPENSQTLAQSTSNGGAVIVGHGEGLTTLDEDRAQIWTPTAGLRFLQDAIAQDFGTDTTGWALSHANDVSPDGRVIVGRGLYDGRQSAFRWTPTGGLVDLGTFGGVATYAEATSDDGAVVVGGAWPEGATQPRAFRWSAETGMVDLGTLGGPNAAATGVSGDGRVVFGAAEDENGRSRAVRWIEGGDAVPLGSLGNMGLGRADGSSPDGRVIVGSSVTEDNVWEAFRWTEEQGMVGLGLLDGGRVRARDSRAVATSADGSVVVGGVLNVGGYYEAFVWTQDEGMRLLQPLLEEDYGLDLEGWILVLATSISEDGSVIVGYGFNPDGVYEGWRAEVDLATAGEEDASRAGLSLRAAPNPALGRTTLTLSLDRAGDASVTLHDVLGREVATLHRGPLAAGAHRLPVGVAGLPAGVYVARAEAAGRVISRTLTVVR
ncbi:T9SS type A sorting domain-containing protein [Rubrivirga marina]|nr:T9SS type A sorting domain-containing protein [Rubrivirga marina]